MCDCTCDVSCMSAVQVCAAAESKRHENVTVIKMTPTSSFQPAAPVQKTAVVKLQECVCSSQSLIAGYAVYKCAPLTVFSFRYYRKKKQLCNNYMTDGHICFHLKYLKLELCVNNNTSSLINNTNENRMMLESCSLIVE